MTGSRAPLDDPHYEPKHPSVNGQIPEVVAKWAPRSQIRWFRRFRREVGAQRADVWDRHHCASLHHRGLCCHSCDEESTFPLPAAGGGPALCCCRDPRLGK